MDTDQIIEWLLEGDVSIQYQVHRDLLGSNRIDLQQRIGQEGWGREFLSRRKLNGHWGQRFYQPKWISTHYTLLDLRLLNLDPNNEIVQETIEMVLENGKAQDGGIPLGPSTSVHSDVCVNAMFLNYAAYFGIEKEKLYSIVDSILNEKMPDGGFNCRTTRGGAKHSSLHTSLSVVEGLFEFQKAGYTYKKEKIRQSLKSAEEFILLHQFYISDRTGEIISNGFLRLAFPGRWKFDILRGLDYFQYAGRPYDPRMESALQIIQKKRNRLGSWNIQAAHPGQVHFIMEKAGKPSRWNTLRSLRVLNQFIDADSMNK